MPTYGYECDKTYRDRLMSEYRAKIEAKGVAPGTNKHSHLMYQFKKRKGL